MEKRKLNFWVMLLVGIPAFIWLFVELLRVFLEIVNRYGIFSVPLDGVIQHKVGELMVATPLFLILLLSNKWSKERIITLVNRMRDVMIIGGLLNGLAWISMRDRESWDSFFRVWCLILLCVGLFGSQIAKWVVSKAKESSA